MQRASNSKTRWWQLGPDSRVQRVGPSTYVGIGSPPCPSTPGECCTIRGCPILTSPDLGPSQHFRRIIHKAGRRHWAWAKREWWGRGTGRAALTSRRACAGHVRRKHCHTWLTAKHHLPVSLLYNNGVGRPKNVLEKTRQHPTISHCVGTTFQGAFQRSWEDSPS